MIDTTEYPTVSDSYLGIQGDWVHWPDGECTNNMAMIGEDSNRVPFVDQTEYNWNIKQGDYIHAAMACKFLKKEPVFESPEWKKSTSYYVDKLMKGFVDKYVDQVVGVEATIQNPDEPNKKVRCDLLAYCKDPYGDCSGGWGPTCIIDWKYVNGRFNPYYYHDKMELYKKAYEEAQTRNSGPFLSHVLVVAVNSAGRVKIKRYFGEDTSW